MKRLKTLKYIAFCTLTAAAFTSCEILDSGSRSTSDLEIDGTTIKLHIAKGNTRGVEYYTPTDEEGGYTLPIDPDKVSLPLAIKVMTEEVESKWQNISEFTCYDYMWNPDKLRLTHKPTYVYAWYPTDLPSNGKIDVKTPKIVTRQSCFDSEETETVDYLYGRGVNAITQEYTVSADDNDNHVRLTLKHALTKIHIVIQRDETYTGKGAISLLEVITEDNKVCNNAKMNVKTGEISDCTADNNVVRWEIPTEKVNTDPTTHYYALTVPIPNGEQRPIKFALVDGNDYIESENLKETLGERWTQEYLAWEQGNEYIYIIRLRGRQLKVKVVSVEDYENVDGNGDDDWIDIEPDKDQFDD